MPFRLIQHGTVDSTNERAFEELAAGRARHRDVHVARAQARGRGRLGRTWASPADEGLYLSLVWRPDPPPPPAPALTVAAALAVHDTAGELGLEDHRLKWPNDLLVGDAKLVGVLIETRGLDPAAPHYVVGVGWNVRQRTFPADLGQPVTSLALLERDAAVEDVRDALLARLDARLGQVGTEDERLARDYVAAARLTGRVLVEGPEGEVAGDLRALTFAGGLVLAPEDGPAVRLPLEQVRHVTPLSGRS